MIVKFSKEITDYKYLVMFDLASKKTGVCLYDIYKNEPIHTSMIIVNNHELGIVDLYNLIDEYFKKLVKNGISLSDIFVSFESMPTQIRSGKGSTIQTFLALAKAHAILDLYLYQHDIDVYDYVGIYPITTHNYLKKILNKSKVDKVDKDDIKKYVVDYYKLKQDITFDESDAVFLAKTLIDVKWNKDIDEEIKVKKRHKKTLKAQHAIKNVDDQIKELERKKIYTN